MVQSNLALKIINKLVKLKESKNFFAIEKNSFYAEPILFYINDIFISSKEPGKLKQPKEFGLYSFTTSVQLLHSPKKKVILQKDSITYQIYGIRSETVFYVSEICRKPHNSIQKDTYVGPEIISNSGATQTIKEMDSILSRLFPTLN